MGKTVDTNEEMTQKNSSDSKFLTACLCKLQLPHTEEHAEVLPRLLMPTLNLPEKKYSCLDPDHEQSKRVQDLLIDVDAARAEDLQLQRKFEKEANELLKAYEQGLKCDHWIPKDIADSGMEESTARLKYELDHSKFQLAEARNQLHSLKRELATYEKLVKQEIGDTANLHEILLSGRWRGRAQEIERLKKEIASMESKAYDHKYLKNPLCIPTYKPRFPDVNDLVPREQVKVLQREALKKRELREKTEHEVTILLDTYGNISLMYKASLTHNKMLSEELRSLKDQLNKYEVRAKGDRDLMKNLIAHQMQMRDMVDREAHLARLIQKKQNEETDIGKKNVLDAVKYKALLEASESEKYSLEKMVQTLTQRLEDVIETAEEAEKHCADNEAKRLEIEQQVEAEKAAQIAAKSKGAKGKAGKSASQPGSKSLQIGAQIEVVKEENEYLRNFLLRAIQTKVEDLKLYQFTMNSIRDQYIEALKELKSPSETETPEAKTPEVKTPEAKTPATK